MPLSRQPSRLRVRNSLRRFVEFKGIRRSHASEYQDTVKRLYDGPRGAAIRLSSVISLHDPLVGLMLKSGRFDISRFDCILDVGSGSGQILRHVLRQTGDGVRIVACDLSPNMLHRARQRLKSDRPEFVAADMKNLPFADGSFDCVTCGWVIEHLPDPRPGLQEMLRVLQPGGSLLLMATEDTLTGALSSRTWKCRTYNRDELRQACEEVGFEWTQQFWFTRVHRALRLGGILVEVRKST
jgi:SAM-dependent methyltransferase